MWSLLGHQPTDGDEVAASPKSITVEGRSGFDGRNWMGRIRDDRGGATKLVGIFVRECAADDQRGMWDSGADRRSEPKDLFRRPPPLVSLVVSTVHGDEHSRTRERPGDERHYSWPQRVKVDDVEISADAIEGRPECMDHCADAGGLSRWKVDEAHTVDHGGMSRVVLGATKDGYVVTASDQFSGENIDDGFDSAIMCRDAARPDHGDS